jgi:small subunit ribosomal protein S5
VGDNKGRVGFGMGKARSVPDAIRKAIEAARKDMEPMSMVGSTIPHEIIGRHGSAKVLLKPASPGTGVIAGGSVRAVIEATGYRDILAKSLGSNNVLNVILATMDGLRRLKSVQEVAADRGKDVAEVAPFWTRR